MASEWSATLTNQMISWLPPNSIIAQRLYGHFSASFSKKNR